MAGKIYLGVGVQFLFNGRQFRITEQIERETFEVVDLGFDNIKQQFSRKQIEAELENGNLRFAEQGKNTIGGQYDFDSIEDFTNEEKRRIEFRKNAIFPLLKISAKSLDVFVQARVSMLKIQQQPDKNVKASRASIYRWLKDYQNSNCDIRSLVSKSYKCGNKESKTDIEVEHIMDSIIDKFYYSNERISQESIYDLVYNRIVNENLKRTDEEKLNAPSKSTVRRRIVARDKYKTAKARKGSKHAWDKYGQVTRREKPEYPFQRVEVDHTKLDLFVVDDKNRLPIGRPYLTSVIDVFDGYPLGLYIGFEPPSYTSVMLALSHAISPKTYVKEKYPEIQNEWKAYGVPELLVVDNGKEFLSKHLKEACLDLGIELFHCPVKMPWYKGTVERYFRTINQQLIHQTQGTTFSNVIDKGDYDPQKNAVISFSRLLEMMHIWILDYYTQKFNTGIQAIPAKKRERALEIMDSPLPTDLKDWKIRLMKVGSGSIQRSGIRTKHLYYQSKGLMPIKNQLERDGEKNVVKFKYDPTDLSKIFVYDELNKRYIEVLCTNQEYAKGLNEYAHNVIQNELKREEKEASQENLAATKAKIMRIIEEERNLTLTERRNNERIKGTGLNKECAESSEKHVEEKTDVITIDVKQKTKKEQVNSNKVNIDDDIDYSDWGVLNAN
ncbi:DDE-type integrase/transposase/recombinase [Bacillus thuringiensis]|uniref:Mu transposase C-terminal domain-containing protein n=1 Tax=Bacillus thuringiensis TaxID=1428 RepID=UPI003977D065